MVSLWFVVVCLISFSGALENEDCDFPPGGSSFGPEQHIKVNRNAKSKYVLSSAGFPDCCKPKKWQLSASDRQTSHWKMIFTDLDIPLGSKLCVIGEGRSQENLLMVYSNIKSTSRGEKVMVSTDIGSHNWYKRPVISFEGYEISVIFVPPDYSPFQHTGFKAEYWIDSVGGWPDGQPVTDCPPIVDPMLGGEIKLTTATLTSKNEAKDSYFDCRWQIKPPDSDLLDNYVRLTALSLPSGNLKIYQGISSPDTTSSDDQQNRVFRAMNIDKEVFLSSRKGFYIELRKPLTEGKIEFTYGVGQTLLENEEKKFLMNLLFLVISSACLV